MEVAKKHTKEREVRRSGGHAPLIYMENVSLQIWLHSLSTNSGILQSYTP